MVMGPMLETVDHIIGSLRTVLHASLGKESGKPFVQGRNISFFTLSCRYIYIADPGCLRSSGSVEPSAPTRVIRTPPIRIL